METVARYREIVETVMQTYAHKPSHGEIEVELIVDAARTHYEIMFVGWQNDTRVHGTVLHIDLIGDKIWIQHDGTSPGVALEFVEAGVPRTDIILGFRPPHLRALTGYGVN